MNAVFLDHRLANTVPKKLEGPRGGARSGVSICGYLGSVLALRLHEFRRNILEILVSVCSMPAHLPQAKVAFS